MKKATLAQLQGLKIEVEKVIVGAKKLGFPTQALVNFVEQDVDDAISCHPSRVKMKFIKNGLLKEVFKKVHYRNKGFIAVLQIPAKALRNQDKQDDYKCRASEAKVLRLETLGGKKCPKKFVASSGHDSSFKYKAGTVVRPKSPFDKSKQACAPGIHFFMLRHDALNY